MVQEVLLEVGNFLLVTLDVELLQYIMIFIFGLLVEVLVEELQDLQEEVEEEHVVIKGHLQ
jgi:hypothetical protein